MKNHVDSYRKFRGSAHVVDGQALSDGQEQSIRMTYMAGFIDGLSLLVQSNAAGEPANDALNRLLGGVLKDYVDAQKKMLAELGRPQ